MTSLTTIRMVDSMPRNEQKRLNSSRPILKVAADEVIASGDPADEVDPVDLKPVANEVDPAVLKPAANDVDPVDLKPVANDVDPVDPVDPVGVVGVEGTDQRPVLGFH